MNYKDAIHAIIDGEAILFTGSGFSYGAKNGSGENVLLGNQLVKKFMDLTNINEDDDLEFLSDEYIDQNSEQMLIDLLKSLFTISEPMEYHKVISNMSWKKIYTTNYDNLVEISSNDYGRDSINISDSPLECNSKNNIVHLNGSILNLDKDKLRSEFKLTSMSYRSENFVRSSWYGIFENDIKSCSAIFFVGVSMKYDLDIKRALNIDSAFRKKCFFICSQSEEAIHVKKLLKYGEPLSIGVEKFAEDILQEQQNYIKLIDYKKPIYSFKYYSKNDVKYFDFRDEFILKLLMYGDFSNDVYSNYNINNKYVFNRSVIDKVINMDFENINTIIIHSEFGNGKTLVKNILQRELSNVGHVFELIDVYESYYNDVDTIINQYPGIKFVFVENYHNYIQNLNKFMDFKDSNIIFILFERTAIFESRYNLLLESSFFQDEKSFSYSLDVLDDDEVKNLINYIDSAGLWGELKKISYSQKKKLITKQCKKQLNNFLLKLLRSPNLLAKIKTITEPIYSHKDTRDIINIALINNMINLNISLNDILTILDLKGISLKISKDFNLNQVLKITEDKIAINSSVITTVLLENFSNVEELIDLLIRIMYVAENKNTQKYKNIQFNLISFSNVQQVLKMKNRIQFSDSIIRYYERIKNLNYCKDNAFFWIQYANARLALKKYDFAKVCLDNAKASINACNTSHLEYDTCYARYLLEKQLYEKNTQNAFEVFLTAHQLIFYGKNKSDRWHFSLKRTNLYFDYYETFFEKFSEENKINFILCCHQMLEKIDKYVAFQNSNRGKTDYRVRIAEKNIKKIIKDSKHKGY